MSSATYPLGMKTSNNHIFTGGYKTWKGTGINSNPVAITAGNIPPLTNKDYSNSVVYKQGSSRPLKWAYRRGTTTQTSRIIIDPNDNTKLTEFSGGKVEIKRFLNTFIVVNYEPINFPNSNLTIVTSAAENSVVGVFVNTNNEALPFQAVTQ